MVLDLNCLRRQHRRRGLSKSRAPTDDYLWPRPPVVPHVDGARQFRPHLRCGNRRSKNRHAIILILIRRTRFFKEWALKSCSCVRGTQYLKNQNTFAVPAVPNYHTDSSSCRRTVAELTVLRSWTNHFSKCLHKAVNTESKMSYLTYGMRAHVP